MNTRFWVGVVSEEHVQLGVDGGFAQLCHGKCAPLKRMKEGDWLVYYSPKTAYPDGKPLQSFTAIGTVKSGMTYRFEMSPEIIPYRLDIEYRPCQNVSFASIKPMLKFANDDANIGLLFRREHFNTTRRLYGHCQCYGSDFTWNGNRNLTTRRKVRVFYYGK